MSSQPHAAVASQRQYRFGDFTLDLDAGFLRDAAHHEILLRPKAFEALVYLVERHGRLVTKAELLDWLWSDAAVTDNSLAQCLLEIRRAIGDDSHRVIRTVARRGYVFAAPVSSSPVAIGRTASLTTGAQAARESGPVSRPALRAWIVGGAVTAALLVAIGGARVWRAASGPKLLLYTQLTDFTDSAVAPALSRDGRMLAFVRGEHPFMTTDQIYVKLLPDGEAIQLTHDSRPKYHLAFSPDGLQIAYTVVGTENGPGQNATYTMSPLGGEPKVLLTNAAGLTWLDARHLLFSEIKTGLHMGIVTATATRSEYREVYFPGHERAMAHYAFASPDRQWALVIEMDHRPTWQPCRLVPLDGVSTGRTAGPPGYCTGAGWSPDGRWMYFTAAVDEQHHLWRQRFPDGQPQQLTFGTDDEDGIAVAPDGSIVTSIGARQSELWIHDGQGDRPVSSEGAIVSHIASVTRPSFSRDGRHLYYLRRASSGGGPQLWRTDLASGHTEAVLPGVEVTEYDLSEDGRVVFSVQPAGTSQLWVSPLDRGAPPRQIAASGETAPFFGLGNTVLFRFTKGNTSFVGRMNADGSGRTQAMPHPIGNVQNISPDRRWLVAIAPIVGGSRSAATVAFSMPGGAPRPICEGTCPCAWSPDGTILYVELERRSRVSAGKMVGLPVLRETGLPALPETGIRSVPQALAIPGSRLIERSDIVPGIDPGTYAYLKTAVHRNLFRLRLP